MPDTPPASKRSPLASLALVALLIALGAGLLYVMGTPSGKKGADERSAEAEAEANAACAASRVIAEAVKDLARGEVAAMAISKTPEPLGEVAFNGPDGQPKTLADFKGKTVLLNLWATWCVPCRAEMPALDRLQAHAGSEKFEVAAVNVDTSRLDRPKAFLNEIGVKSLTYYADPKANVFFEMKQAGKALGLPTTMLVDPAGCLIGLMNGPAAWDSADAKALIARALDAAAAP